jgi:hypothetical protein
MVDTKNEVATVDEKSKAVATYDYGDDAGAGFENVKPGDFKPSFLRILQSNSPQVADELPGAKAGIWWDTVSNEGFESILVVPAVFEHVYVAWKPRADGGGGGQGFGGVYKPESEVVVEALKRFNSEHDSKFARGEDGKIIAPKTPDGEYDLMETFYFHGPQFVEESGAIFPVTLPFSSSGLPPAQNWLSTMRKQIIPDSGGKPYPLFAHLFKLGSVKKENAKGKFYVPSVTWAKGNAKDSRLDPKGDLYQAARSVSIAFKEGNAKVDYAQSGGSDAPAGGAGSGKSKGDIPF